VIYGAGIFNPVRVLLYLDGNDPRLGATSLQLPEDDRDMLDVLLVFLGKRVNEANDHEEFRFAQAEEQDDSYHLQSDARHNYLHSCHAQPTNTIADCYHKYGQH
jgi:hypothetical protein